MSQGSATPEIRDYSLVGKESILSLEKGLAEANWYSSPVPRDTMRVLLKRKNGPALRDTLLWFALILGSAFLVVLLWGSWWFIFPYLAYAVLYASTSDSRWHESSHGTAFRTGWMNDTLYEIASFMVFRQSTVWRWSHTRHHSDTLVRGRDPEIAAPRPPDIKGIIMNFFALRSAPAELRRMVIHATGRIDREVATYLPQSEYRKVYWKARIYLLIYMLSITLSILLSSPLPVMFIGLPTLVGTWLMPVYGLTQHAGLAENVLDHRLNCRTVYMNRVHRFLYWNMNYHVEHHMFPMIPYHALPGLHELMKEDCPEPYGSILEAYREIIPTLRKQVKDPGYFAERKLPENSGKVEEAPHRFKASTMDAGEDGLILICKSDELLPGQVIRFDLDDQTFAIYRAESALVYATDGICTHGNTHLSEGLVMGDQIECPKHNGCFTFTDGKAQRAPVCDALRTYGVTEREDKVFFSSESLTKAETDEMQFRFRVISNDNVTTFIKELVLEPVGADNSPEYLPGDHIKIEIPVHQTSFRSIRVKQSYSRTWRDLNLFHHHSFNPIQTRRNYSLASNPVLDNLLRFNIRIALPPPGVDCYAGVGSSYIFGLKPGDEVLASAPHGDFHVKETMRDIVYVGGGAGMAPIRSHISWLFETEKTDRRVIYWYGARSGSEIFYSDYFMKLAEDHSNFDFQISLSEALESDPWESHRGLIHEVLEKEYLSRIDDAAEKEYYICGPPAMVRAVKRVLGDHKVPGDQIFFDEF